MNSNCLSAIADVLVSAVTVYFTISGKSAFATSGI